MKKKKIRMDYSMTLEDCFEQFLMAKKAKGVVDKTIQSYKYNFVAISKHLLTSINISELTSKHLLTMIESMRNSNLCFTESYLTNFACIVIYLIHADMGYHYIGRRKVDLGILETLIERSKIFKYKNTHFFLFSKSGFTKGCIEKAKGLGNVSLVKYSDILKTLG